MHYQKLEYFTMEQTAVIDNENKNMDKKVSKIQDLLEGIVKIISNSLKNMILRLKSLKWGLINKTTTKNLENEVKNQWLHLTKPVRNMDLPMDLYAKCMFNKQMKTLAYKNGSLVERPEGTCLRLGYEVFLCPQYRPSALGKNLFFGGGSLSLIRTIR